MELTEKYYFNPSSSDKNTECYIWFSEKKELELLKENHQDILDKFIPISKLPEYLSEHPNHKIHTSALEDVSDRTELSNCLSEKKIILVD